MMRPFAVAFANDPPGYARLVLAQDGQTFLVTRADHDPETVPAAFWFTFEDEGLGARVVNVFFSEDEGWAKVFRPEEEEAPAGPPLRAAARRRMKRR